MRAEVEILADSLISNLLQSLLHSALLHSWVDRQTQLFRLILSFFQLRQATTMQYRERPSQVPRPFCVVRWGTWLGETQTWNIIIATDTVALSPSLYLFHKYKITKKLWHMTLHCNVLILHCFSKSSKTTIQVRYCRWLELRCNPFVLELHQGCLIHLCKNFSKLSHLQVLPF